MSNIKHRIFVGHNLSEDINETINVPLLPPFSFDSTTITFDSRVRRFDETI